MKKKWKNSAWVWGGILILITLIGVAAVSSSSPSPVAATSNATLTLSESSWDFGDIPMQDGVITRSISLKNDSTDPITLTSLSTSCMCTTAQVVHADGSKSGLKSMVGHGGGTASLSEIIQAGEEVMLLVNFDPNAHGPSATGPITRTVMIDTNSQAQPHIQLDFSGTVVK